MTVQIERIKKISRYLLSGRFDHIGYALWVRGKGLDFAPVSVKNLGLSHQRSKHHAASGGVFLADVLRKIDIPRGSRVVDLGCGKGSAMCTLARFPFDEVAGVDLSERMARIAESNCRKLKLKNLRIYVADASEFNEFDRFSHIYMFNPFPETVMAEVMRNVATSLRRLPRRLTVIYFFPTCHDTVMQSGLFQTHMEIDPKLTHPYRIYVHSAQPRLAN